MDKITILVLSALFATINVFAQNFPSNSHISELISSRQGLPFDYVDDIFQDESGFVWICMYGGGLARFDGQDFITYTTATEQHISDDYVTMSCQDNFHRLWISTRRGINTIDLKTLEVIPLPEPVGTVSKKNFCNCISKDADGNIWFSMRMKLFRVGFTDTGDVASIDSLSISTSSTPSDASIVNLQIFQDVDQDGTMWIAIENKLYKVSRNKDGGLSRNLISRTLDIGTRNKITGFVKKGNEVWIASDNGLYRYDDNTGDWKHYTHNPDDPNSLASDKIPAIALSEEQRILVGTIKGLNIYNPLSDTFDHFNSDLDRYGNKCLYNDFINCIEVIGPDIWIGTEIEGITCLKKKRIEVTNIQHRPNDSQSFPPGPVSEIYFDSKKRLWLGLVQHGLYLNEDRTGKFKRFMTSASSNNTVNAVEEDGKGNIWVGTWGGGIEIIKGSHSEILMDAPLYVFDLKYDSINQLMWVAGQGSIRCYDAKKSSFKDELQIEANSCYVLFIDSLGNLWAGHQNGIIVIDLHTLKARQCNKIQRVYCITEGGNGEILLGTNGDGMAVIQLDDEEISVERTITKDEGLPSNTITAILRGNDAIWVSTSEGLAAIDDDGIRSFSRSDGLASNRFCRNSGSISPDRNLCFGHSGGFLVINSDQQIGDLQQSRLLFTRLETSETSRNISYDSKINLHERDRSMCIGFADLSFNDEMDVRFNYRIFPREKSWTALESRDRKIRIGSLPRGKYKLMLMENRSSGEEIGRTSLVIEVKPYFYKTISFKIVLVCLLIMIIKLLINEKTKRYQKREKELQQEIRKHVQNVYEQKIALEEKTEELMRQNKQLIKQNEELASQKLLNNIEIREERGVSDKKLMEKAIKTVKELYKDSTLNVGVFCKAMGMSRSQVNIKMNEISGMPVGQFIRTYRLTVAKEILAHKEKSEMNVAEVAYEVGFNDPKYFSRCFTKEFGYPPSATVKGNAQGYM